MMILRSRSQCAAVFVPALHAASQPGRALAQWLLMAIVVGLSVPCAGYYWLKWHRRVAALNSLRDEINAHYGYRDGTPCINWGPCGRFGNAFREQWNARFRDKVNIAFVMAPDGLCHHVALRFPGGSCFDGGNGVISEAKLLKGMGSKDCSQSTGRQTAG
jgi:hypothetical protein